MTPGTRSPGCLVDRAVSPQTASTRLLILAGIHGAQDIEMALVLTLGVMRVPLPLRRRISASLRGSKLSMLVHY